MNDQSVLEQLGDEDYLMKDNLQVNDDSLAQSIQRKSGG
jgi:hypothetical protein